MTALFCASADALLIGLGVAGMGAALASNQVLLLLAQWGGALFLFWYGYKAFRSVFRSQSLAVAQGAGPARPSVKETALILAGVTFLNPHVYLDTVFLLGSIGSQYASSERMFFALGAMCASTCWFFGLCYGARFLAPFFEKPLSWKILDGLVGCTMWGIGLSLIFGN